MDSAKEERSPLTDAGQRPGWLKRNRELAVAFVCTLVVVLIRLWMARQVSFCGTPDSCSYLALGESLSRHHTFTENFLYQYQFVDHHLPTHGIDYWKPGVSLLFLLAQPFGGVTLHSSLAVTILMGVLLAAAAWRLAMQWSGQRRIACASYLLCLVLPPVWLGSLTPDSALFYGAFAAWFLALFTVSFHGYIQDVLALACVAMVNLIRNDAILLLAPLLVVLWIRGRTHGRGPGASPGYAALMLAGFGLAMLPMHLIDYAVLGRFSAGGGAGTFYLTGLSDLTNYTQPISLHHMLSTGIGELVKMRIVAEPMIVYRIIFLYVGFPVIFLIAFALRGKERGTNHPELTGGITFGLVLVAFYGLVLPAIGTFSALRSFMGLLPLSAALIVAAIRWGAYARPARGFVGATILFFFISGTMDERRGIPELNKIGDEDRRVGAYLASHGADQARATLIMTDDAAQFSETTGYPAIPVPNDGLAATAQAAADLHATHILLEQERLQGTEAEVRAALQPATMAQVPGTHLLVLTMGPRTQ